MGYKLKRILIYPDGVTEKQVRPVKVWNGDLSRVNESTKVSKTWTTGNNYGYGFRWNKDGTLVTVSFSANKIIQYPLSTAWDINSIGNASYTLSTSNEYPYLIFSQDGKKAIARYSGYSGNTTFYVFNLSTPYDLSTKDSGTAYNMGGNYPTPFDISPDGKNFIYNNNGNSKVFYSVSNTAWVLNTSGTEILSGSGIYDGIMSKDGKYLYTINGGSHIVYRYKLSTAWDISTLDTTVDQQVTLSVSNQIAGISFDTYGDNMFILCQSIGTQYLYKYPLT